MSIAPRSPPRCRSAQWGLFTNAEKRLMYKWCNRYLINISVTLRVFRSFLPFSSLTALMSISVDCFCSFQGFKEMDSYNIAFLCVWLLSCNIMFLRSIYVAVGIKYPLFLLLNKYSIVWMYHSLFIHLPVEDHFYTSHFMGLCFYFSW